MSIAKNEIRAAGMTRHHVVQTIGLGKLVFYLFAKNNRGGGSLHSVAPESKRGRAFLVQAGTD